MYVYMFLSPHSTSLKLFNLGLCHWCELFEDIYYNLMSTFPKTESTKINLERKSTHNMMLLGGQFCQRHRPMIWIEIWISRDFIDQQKIGIIKISIFVKLVKMPKKNLNNSSFPYCHKVCCSYVISCLF